MKQEANFRVFVESKMNNGKRIAGGFERIVPITSFAVVYVYDNDEIENIYMPSGTFEHNMKYIIDLYRHASGSEPTLAEITEWRKYFSLLKSLNVIE